jgi:Asp/Glu/hydantoin racemase
MNHRLVLIHTVSPLVDVFNTLGLELLPGVQLMHILDEPILELERQGNGLTSEASKRLGTHVAAAERVGASAALVTCSTISPNVDDVRSQANIPVLKIDEAMVARAVSIGSKIGVVATAASTLEPTRQLLQARADTSGKKIDVELVLVERALSALLSGDGATHDRLVRESTLELARRVDVVVLAQASMARVLEAIPEAGREVPILSSPHLALEQVKQLLAPSHSIG